VWRDPPIESVHDVEYTASCAIDIGDDEERRETEADGRPM